MPCNSEFEACCVQKKAEQMKKGLLRKIALLCVVLCNIGCDQLSKEVVRERIDYREVIEVLGDTFVLTKVENTGAFLSLGNAWPEPVKWLALIVLPILILAYGLYIMFATRYISYPMAFGLAFAIGGGFGNMYDRLVYGSVTDFMHVDFGFVRSGVFNMADLSITIGVILIFVDVVNRRRSKGQQASVTL